MKEKRSLEWKKETNINKKETKKKLTQRKKNGKYENMKITTKKQTETKIRERERERERERK